MVSFAEIEYFGDQILAYFYIAGFNVKMDDLLTRQMAQSMDNIDKNEYFGPEGWVAPYPEEVIELIPVYHLHQQHIAQVRNLTRPVVLREEYTAAAFKFTNYFFLMRKFIVVFLGQLGLELFNSDNHFWFLISPL